MLQILYLTSGLRAAYWYSRLPVQANPFLKGFFASPLQFFQDYWLPAWHGIVAWALVAVPLALLARLIILPILRRAAIRIEKRKEATA